MHFNPTNIKEFNELNDAVVKMTSKIYNDFVREKEFTENASHEIQTPLAVIKSKIELLMQSENLKESEMAQIQIIERSVNKLSSLNKALLLLVKIENKQFNGVEELSLKKSLEGILTHYKTLIDNKNITISIMFSNDIMLQMNLELLEILLTNLIQNAIRHNFKNGFISVEIEGNILRVSNSGSPSQIRPNELFERFKKGVNSKESLGIGLAIVKSITDTHGIIIEYSYLNKHVFSLAF